MRLTLSVALLVLVACLLHPVIGVRKKKQGKIGRVSIGFTQDITGHRLLALTNAKPRRLMLVEFYAPWYGHTVNPIEYSLDSFAFICRAGVRSARNSNPNMNRLQTSYSARTKANLTFTLSMPPQTAAPVCETQLMSVA